MINGQVEAIIFDVGGTLRRSRRRPKQEKMEWIQRMQELIGSTLPIERFYNRLMARGRAYKRWSEEALEELNEQDLWTRWMLPDYPAEKIAPQAIPLNQLWRDAHRTSIIFPEAKEVIGALHKGGYRLGLVSNTTSSVEAPLLQKELSVAGCFESMILSCVVGRRKPDPAILLNATQQMGIKPEYCVYVGDRPERDAAAARKAGFAGVVLLENPRRPLNFSSTPDLVPDHIIHNLKELLTLFPPRQQEEKRARPGGNGRSETILYNASLSTMWAMGNFPTLEDFLIAAQRAGYGTAELNYQVNSPMLASLDLTRYRYSSIHEPCPADVTKEELTERDWLMSSTNEENRRLGVNAIKRSIDLAHSLGVKAVVVHSGVVLTSNHVEKEYYRLYNSGKAGTEEYQDLKQRLMERRAVKVGANLEAVARSVKELAEYAGRQGVRLGLENRYHYLDIPLPDEMEYLLELADAEALGFWYDAGHAQALDRLGFHLHEDWLKRFASRMIGCHLHDSVGITDNQAPGRGEMDFEMIARHLPKDAIRTLELNSGTTFAQVKSGLEFLAKKQIVSRL